MFGIGTASLAPGELGSYLVLLLGVAASWIGVPLVGGAVLATAGVLASDGQLDVWLVLLVAAMGAWSGGYIGYLIGVRAGVALISRPGRWQRQRRHAPSPDTLASPDRELRSMFLTATGSGTGAVSRSGSTAADRAFQLPPRPSPTVITFAGAPEQPDLECTDSNCGRKDERDRQDHERSLSRRRIAFR
jgi:hypothetical protein